MSGLVVLMLISCNPDADIETNKILNSDYYRVLSEAFNGVQAKIVSVEPSLVVYQSVSGSCSRTLAAMLEIEKVLDALQIKTNVGYNTYFNIPDQIPEEEQKSETGFFLKDVPDDKLAELGKVLQIKTTEKRKAIAFKMPFKSPEAILKNAKKIYSKIIAIYMKKYSTDQLPPVAPDEYVQEIYDGDKAVIKYLFPVSDWILPGKPPVRSPAATIIAEPTASAATSPAL